MAKLTKYENHRSVQRGGTQHTSDLQCRIEEQTGGVLQEAPRPLPIGKDLRARRRVLSSGQVRLSIRLQPPMSEERRRKASENAKQNGFNSHTE